MGLVVPQFEAVRDTDPILYEGLQKLVKYVSGLSNELKIAPVAAPGASTVSFAFAPPLPPSAFNVTAGGNGYNLVITPNPANGANTQYFVESSPTIQFPNPQIYPLGTAVTASLGIGTDNQFWRVRAKYPQSDYSPYLYAAGASAIAAGNLDTIPDGVTYMRPSRLRLNGATDINGNLLLKNVVSGGGSTANPQTTSAVFAVMPEMTQTVTTKGNKVLIEFAGTFNTSPGTTAKFAIFRDGVQISVTYQVWITGSLYTVSLSWIDTVAAGNHTYDIRWANTGSANPIQAISTDRALEVVELG